MGSQSDVSRGIWWNLVEFVCIFGGLKRSLLNKISQDKTLVIIITKYFYEFYRWVGTLTNYLTPFVFDVLKIETCPCEVPCSPMVRIYDSHS